MSEEHLAKILFVDDDASLRTVVPFALKRDGYDIATASDGYEALDMFAKEKYDLVVQDVRMPGMDGLELLSRLKSENGDIPIIIMTAFSNWDVAVEAMRLGAFDYVKKPFDNDELRNIVKRALAFSAAGDNVDSPEKIRFIGQSAAIKEIQEIIRRVSRTDSTVMVNGESGSGKELVAGLVHAQSPRKSGPFIAVNCGGFSETLLESELFGHVKGAFTGAVADKKGLLELADGGTFFLDELGETTLSTQVRLLRVLETRTFVPVGGEEAKKTDVRFVAATNRNLSEMVAAGTFREDLFYRLNVISIVVPPLRERKDDIPLLAGYFLSLYSERFGKNVTGFDDAATEAVLSYDWPGNVRELQNAIQRAVSLAEGELVSFMDLFPSWARIQHVEPAKGLPAGSSTASSESGEMSMPPLMDTGFDLEKVMDEIEARYLAAALEKTGHNLTQAAEMLGITFRSIRYKVKKLKLDK